jgi:hypothetical protein
MATNEQESFEVTMTQLEQGFQTRHIWSTPVMCCQAEELASSVLARYPDFDQIPVASGQSVIGVLLRGAAVDGHLAQDCMCKLQGDLLTAADQPLLPLLEDLLTPPYFRLVVDGKGNRGIVTRSDVVKLPVRILAFTLVAHVESILTRMISERCPDTSSLISNLDEGARKKLEEDLEKYKQQRADPPAIEFLTFYQKIELGRKLFKFSIRCTTDLHSIRGVRNEVDHLHDFAYSLPKLVAFVDALQLTRKWIARYQH